MAEKKELPTYDFFTITKEDIHDFLKANATPKEIDDFREKAFIKQQETVMVPDIVIGNDGKPIQKQVRKYNKEDGTYKVAPKLKAIPVKGGEIKEKYSHRKAVSWFIDTYVDVNEPKAIIINRPQKAKKEEKVKAKDLFADLW